MKSVINGVSSQAWYFLTACLGIFTCTIPFLFHIHDMGMVTAFIGVGGPLVGVAAGGLQSDTKRSTTTDSPSGTITKTTVQTPAAPPDAPIEPPAV